ncbi:MAG: SDR family oxidoreductase [Bacteroidota bacterium]
MSYVLVTGANGFLGRALIEQLSKDERYKSVAVVRNNSISRIKGVPTSIVGGLSCNTDWGKVLVDIDVVIHTAARVHVMNDRSTDPLTEFRKVNFEGTMALAQQAVRAGVRRFIFISSIKVNGEETELAKPFTVDNRPAPLDSYGVSKAETEQALLELAGNTDLEVVIIRPVLVYGPGVKANFYNMMSWLNRGIPLPFGSIKNKRSLIALENLVSFIIYCVDYTNTPKAANQVFLISDGEDISTTDLLKKTANALGNKVFLIPVPVLLMTFVAKILGKGDVANRLFGSLQVDSSKARELLDWSPVITMEEQLKKTADAFLEGKVSKK